MKPSDMMPTQHDQTILWQLSDDRRMVHMLLPGLVLRGMTKPIRVRGELDAGAFDQMMERLMVLRAQMLPRGAKSTRAN